MRKVYVTRSQKQKNKNTNNKITNQSKMLLKKNSTEHFILLSFILIRYPLRLSGKKKEMSLLTLMPNGSTTRLYV